MGGGASNQGVYFGFIERLLLVMRTASGGQFGIA
jgi:hypothetical protein